MKSFKEIDGNMITLAFEQQFDVITHGANCFCVMGAGLAPQMAKAFACDKFPMEGGKFRGNMNKLGSIDYQWCYLKPNHPAMAVQEDDSLKPVAVVNSYTQYDLKPDANGKPPIDYEALTMCMRKINHTFKGKHIGLPQIGAKLAGGDWNRILDIIKTELTDMDVTIVYFPPRTPTPVDADSK